MTIDIIKCIVFAIAISILYGMLGYLERKKAAVGVRMQSDTQYAVRVPSALKYVYMVMFLLGIALFLYIPRIQSEWKSSPLRWGTSIFRLSLRELVCLS